MRNVSSEDPDYREELDKSGIIVGFILSSLSGALIGFVLGYVMK